MTRHLTFPNLFFMHTVPAGLVRFQQLKYFVHHVPFQRPLHNHLSEKHQLGKLEHLTSEVFPGSGVQA